MAGMLFRRQTQKWRDRPDWPFPRWLPGGLARFVAACASRWPRSQAGPRRGFGPRENASSGLRS